MHQGSTDPVIVTDLYPLMRQSGIAMLRTLSVGDWSLPTACDGWSVHDVALHILGGVLANISRRQDGHAGNFSEFSPIDDTVEDPERLVATLNTWNQAWVRATRRLSPELTIDLLDDAGRRFERYIRSIDMMSLGDPVGWAGPEPAPIWLDIAGEYTEVWSHLAQTREATGRPLIDSPSLFAPVVATFAHAIPPALSAVTRPAGTRVRVLVTGDAGGAWMATVTSTGSWSLIQPDAGPADATVTLDAGTFWRLGTKGIDPADALRRMTIEGDRELGETLLNLIAILA